MVSIDPNLLAEVVALARRAGDAILSVYGQQFEVTRKADQSPLTLADLRSHEIIVQGLHALTPDLPVLSEEASDIPYSSAASGDATGWSIRSTAPRNSCRAMASSRSTSR